MVVGARAALSAGTTYTTRELQQRFGGDGAFDGTIDRLIAAGSIIPSLHGGGHCMLPTFERDFLWRVGAGCLA